MTTATAAQNNPFGRGYPVKLPTPNTAQIGGSRAKAVWGDGIGNFGATFWGALQ